MRGHAACQEAATSSSSRRTNLYAAIDQLMDKLDRQVVRHKDRTQEHHHASAKRLDLGAI